AYDDGVLQADRDSGQRTLEVDSLGVFEGVLGGGDEDLGQAVGLEVGSDGNLAVGLEHGEWQYGIGLEAGCELGDGVVNGVEVFVGLG
ncbi:hypothetical protein OFC03_30275, partial [Escherichia coli]|nr:hypothetical protein [Escherichia coli]